MISLLLVAQPVIQSVPVQEPPACIAKRQALVDAYADRTNLRYASDRFPGPSVLGRKLIAASDALAVAMRDEQPNFEQIETLWNQVNKIKVEIGIRQVESETACTLALLRQAPEAERKAALRRMSPPTSAERELASKIRPVAPPPPPMPAKSRN